MKSLSDVFAVLRRKNIRQYYLLAGCCFFSSLLITAYSIIMCSKTVMNVLPQGGDSRKQVMMIFGLALIGCGIFTAYAAGLFLRYKSHETGVMRALGAEAGRIKIQLARELTVMVLSACAAGIILGWPLSWGIWQGFRLMVADTGEMRLMLEGKAYLYPCVFMAYSAVMVFFMLSYSISRRSIMDIVNESHKSEQVKAVPGFYGPLGLVLLAAGAVAGYFAPVFCMEVFHWIPQGGIVYIAYLPALAGLYMVLLHTVANGWRRGAGRYRNIVVSGMMKFQGRQTVRNMLVIAVLVAGAYFAAFYVPMMGTGASRDYRTRSVDYAFRYRADQKVPGEEEIRKMAEEEGVSLAGYTACPSAVLGVDGWGYVESDGVMGITYTIEHFDLHHSENFLSESAYNSLTGDSVEVKPGSVMAVYDDEGSNQQRTPREIGRITNPLTGKVLHVSPDDQILCNSMLFGCKVLNDTDYEMITAGLTDEWFENQVFFNVENVMETYAFAKRLFHEIADRSETEVLVYDGYDPIVKIQEEEKGEAYFLDREHQEENGYKLLSKEEKDSSQFRLFWKYMPSFRVLDQDDYVKTHAVFLMLFLFISVICFAAVAVTAFTRSITIAMNNARVYNDLRRLGASPSWLLHTVRGQISKVFFVPVLTGTAVICAFYMMILYFNDGTISAGEISGILMCLAVVGVISAMLYGVYRFTLRVVCRELGVADVIPNQR